MLRLFAASLLVTVSVAPTLADDLPHIAKQAAKCWTTPSSMRGVKLDVVFDVRFTRDGHADVVQIVEFAPETETGHALAMDVASALKRCGPYVTEGMKALTVSLSWPM